MNYNNTKSFYFINYAVIIGVVVIVFLFGGCQQKTESTNHSEIPRQHHLQLSARVDSASFITIEANILEGNYEGDITYSGLADVKVAINDTAYPLKDAIRDGLISVEELIACARTDARNGKCLEKYISEHGLTRFTYYYSDFELSYVNDVYETPDGRHHLIQDFGIYAPGKSRDVSHSYYDPNAEYPTKLDKEDWGLTFEVAETTPTSVTLNYSQSDGQQIGELEVSSFAIYSETQPLSRIQQPQSEYVFTPILIAQDTVSRFTIDWNEIYGQIPSGKYLLHLRINDIYDESQVHPLMENFYDEQGYKIEFEIP